MKSKKVSFPEVKRLLKKYKLVCKYKKYDKEGNKTIYYVVRHKTQEEKYEDIIKMTPFEENKNKK